jgi:hypothetical protein
MGKDIHLGTIKISAKCSSYLYQRRISSLLCSSRHHQNLPLCELYELSDDPNYENSENKKKMKLQKKKNIQENGGPLISDIYEPDIQQMISGIPPTYDENLNSFGGI